MAITATRAAADEIHVFRGNAQRNRVLEYVMQGMHINVGGFS